MNLRVFVLYAGGLEIFEDEKRARAEARQVIKDQGFTRDRKDDLQRLKEWDPDRESYVDFNIDSGEDSCPDKMILQAFNLPIEQIKIKKFPNI